MATRRRADRLKEQPKRRSQRLGKVSLLEYEKSPGLKVITPRTVFRKVLQTQPIVSPVVPEKADTPEPVETVFKFPSKNAAYSNLEISLTGPVPEEAFHPVLQKHGKKKKVRLSEFERAVDKQLQSTTVKSILDNTSLTRSLQVTLGTPVTPPSDGKRGLSRRPKSYKGVNVMTFEGGIEQNLLQIKGSAQNHLVDLHASALSNATETIYANTELFAQSQLSGQGKTGLHDLPSEPGSSRKSLSQRIMLSSAADLQTPQQHAESDTNAGKVISVPGTKCVDGIEGVPKEKTDNPSEEQQESELAIEGGMTNSNLRETLSPDSEHVAGIGAVPQQRTLSLGRAQQGSPHGDSRMNQQGSPHGDSRMDKQGSPHGDSRMNQQGSPHGDRRMDQQGSPHGDRRMDQQGSLHGDRRMDQQGSLHGDRRMDQQGSPHGDRRMDQQGSLHRDRHMEQQGSPHGDSRMEQQGSLHGDCRMEQQGSPHGDRRLEQQGSPHGDRLMEQQGSLQGDSRMEQQGSPHGDSLMEQQGSRHGDHPLELHSSPKEHHLHDTSTPKSSVPIDAELPVALAGGRHAFMQDKSTKRSVKAIVEHIIEELDKNMAPCVVDQDAPEADPEGEPFPSEGAAQISQRTGIRTPRRSVSRQEAEHVEREAIDEAKPRELSDLESEADVASEVEMEHEVENMSEAEMDSENNGEKAHLESEADVASEVEMEPEVESISEAEMNSENDEPLEKTPAFVRRKAFQCTPLLSSPHTLKSATSRSASKQLSKKQVPRESKKTHREKRQLGIPSCWLKKIFSHYAKMPVGKEAFQAVQRCVSLYFKHLSDDLEAYTNHARRKTVESADLELLMRRQGLITDKIPLHVLIERHLPLEYRKLLIPVATSGNKITPLNPR